MRTTFAGWLVITGMACVFGIAGAEGTGAQALGKRLEEIGKMDEGRLLEFTAKFKGLVEKADFKAGADGQAALASCRMVVGALLAHLAEAKLPADDARTVAIAETVRMFFTKVEAAHGWRMVKEGEWSDEGVQQEELLQSWMEVISKVAALPLPKEKVLEMFTTAKGPSRNAVRARIGGGGRAVR